MKISSFDTGVTTGVVLCDFKLDCETCLIQQFEFSKDALSIMVDEIISKSEHVLIERIPASSQPTLHDIQNIVFRSCDKYRKTFELIFPGKWKPLARARKWKKTVRSQHVQDAYDLFRYHIIVGYQIELGDL